jgi:hypothetical protein
MEEERLRHIGDNCKFRDVASNMFAPPQSTR